MGEEESAIGGKELSGIELARLELAQAKERFAKAAQEASPLAFVEKYPLKSAGGAFLLGFGMTSLSRSLAMAQLLPLLLQTAESAASLISGLSRHK